MMKFIHFNKFDSSKCVRRFPNTAFAIHAWPIKEEDVDVFLDIYSDGDPVVFDWDEVAGDMKVFVASFPDVDAYVCGRSDSVPEMIQVTTPEEMAKYTAIHTTKTVYCHCGCGMVDGEMSWFENPYQAIIIPRSLISDSSGLRIYSGDDGDDWVGDINLFQGYYFSVDTYLPEYENHMFQNFFLAWQHARKFGKIE